MGQSPVETARLYVGLSNRQDVGAIGPLLADDAVYHSDRVGPHRGRDAILEMMRKFFRRYRHVRWEVKEYRLDADGSVRFDYRISGEAATGHPLAGRGTETIRFSNDGLIAGIEVTAD